MRVSSVLRTRSFDRSVHRRRGARTPPRATNTLAREDLDVACSSAMTNYHLAGVTIVGTPAGPAHVPFLAEAARPNVRGTSSARALEARVPTPPGHKSCNGLPNPPLPRPPWRDAPCTSSGSVELGRRLHSTCASVSQVYHDPPF